MKTRTHILYFSILLFLCFPVAVSAADKPGEIYVLKIDDAISPGVADFIQTEIQRANDENAVCLILELDTPGGLAESMRTIVKAILASRVPVVVYVAPSGARAASAGVMITMAADVTLAGTGDGALRWLDPDDDKLSLGSRFLLR